MTTQYNIKLLKKVSFENNYQVHTTYFIEINEMLGWLNKTELLDGTTDYLMHNGQRLIRNQKKIKKLIEELEEQNDISTN